LIPKKSVLVLTHVEYRVTVCTFVDSTVLRVVDVETEYIVELPVLNDVERLVLVDSIGMVAVVVYAYAGS
jgi:hypothetical protein